MESTSGHRPKGISRANLLASWTRLLTLFSCGLVLIFAPLAYGAVHPWAYFPVGAVLGVLSLILLWGLLYFLTCKPADMSHLTYPPVWWLPVGLVVLISLQLLPWPQAVMRRLSPAAWDIRALGNGLALSDYLPLSLNPYATLLEGLKFWPSVMLFFLLIYTVTRRRQMQRLGELIVVIALFEVLYGFWNFRSSLIWGWKNPYSSQVLLGTFINRNHVAAFLAMAILLSFGLFLAKKAVLLPSSREAPLGKRLRRRSRAEQLEPLVRRYLFLLVPLVLTIGLIFTGSRGGMISLLVGLGLMGLLIWSRHWHRGHLWLMVIFLLFAVLYSLYLGSAPFLGRFLDLDHQGRYLAGKGALTLVREFPWLGSGLATFGDVFYRLEPVQLQGRWVNYTHNDWLQLLTETGLAGFLLVAAAWWALFSGLIKQWQQRRDPFARGLGLGGLAALGAGVFHGLVDFPFHISAFSLLFAAIAALTYLALHSSEPGPEPASLPTLDLRGRRRLARGLVLGLILFQTVFLLQVSWKWLAEGSAPMEIDSTRLPFVIKTEAFRRALWFSPQNSAYYFGLAKALEKQEKHDQAIVVEVEQSLRSAVFSAPANWVYHLSLGEFYLRHYAADPGRQLPRALKELAAAVTLFPESGYLHLRLGLTLAWMETYHIGSLPPEWVGRSFFHLERALTLEPDLKKYLPARSGPQPQK